MLQDLWKGVRKNHYDLGVAVGYVSGVMQNSDVGPGDLWSWLTRDELALYEIAKLVCEKYRLNIFDEIFAYQDETIIPAGNHRDLVRDCFRLKKDGGICHSIDSKFTEWFLGGEEVLGREHLEPRVLHRMRLNRPADFLSRNSGEPTIIAALGGILKAEVGLDAISYLMQQQADGQEGSLLTDLDGGNYFLVSTHNQSVWRLVYIFREFADKGWDVSAYPLGSGEIPAGHQIFAFCDLPGITSPTS